MHLVRRSNDSVHWYMSDLTSRIVADSGRPSDRYHIGKIILQSLRDAPDFVLQIDGSTKASETNSSVLSRSICCAISLKRMGLKYGDVMVLMAPNHLDLAVPFYAALFLGIVIAPVDRMSTAHELQSFFNVIEPKIIFCQSEKVSDIKTALEELQFESQIITFDGRDSQGFQTFLNQCGIDDPEIGKFLPTDFDPEQTTALLVATSGTTGLPKAAASTHKNFAVTGPYWWSKFTAFPCPTLMTLVGSPLQWLTAIYHFVFSPIIRYTRLQSSAAMVSEHFCHLLNVYKPTYTILSPTMMTSLLKTECDLTCFDMIMLGGSAVPSELVTEINKLSPNTEVCITYGISEVTGIGFQADCPPLGSCGKPMGCFQYRLVDIHTQEDITEPNVQGELWMKGPGIFKEYYNNQKATEETFAKDRWFKTGDIFTRDENWNFFFVERYKLLLKYKNHHVSPAELEAVIRQHPSILDVAVTSVTDPECGDLPVACVVRRPGHNVTAKEIKELVAGSLSETKQLRGGVIFIDELPMTASTKIHRRKLKDLAIRLTRE